MKNIKKTYTLCLFLIIVLIFISLKLGAFQSRILIVKFIHPARQESFLPTDLPGLQLWLRSDGKLWQDASRTILAIADGDPIGAWDDSSGHGLNATQALDNAKFTLRIIDGKRLVHAKAQGLSTPPFQLFPNKRGLISVGFSSQRILPQQTLLSTHDSPGHHYLTFYNSTVSSDSYYKFYDGKHYGSKDPDQPFTWYVQQLYDTLPLK